VGTSKWLIAPVLCCLALGAYSARGCEYNVRAVGFIDVGIEPYRLIVYLPENFPAGELSGLKEALEVALVETNIRFEAVTAGADANQPALELVKTHGISRFPAAVLVSPDGQSMPLILSEKETSLAKAVPAALESVLASPLRRQILEKCADVYGVVLLIEGPDSKANAAARETISAAINNINEQMEYLPTPTAGKPIEKPPELAVLDQKSLTREQVLLWTLRLKPEDVNQPRAAVFYGRGRWIGPLFEGENLTAGNLTQLLAIIGGDCECGLDYRWVQGTMLPVRWDEALQQKVVASLGFDPENPMTKMEMVSIVRRGMGGFDYPGVPLDYREIEVGNDVEDTKLMTPGAGQAPPLAVGGLPAPKSPISNEVAPSTSPGRRPALVGQVLAASLGGMIILVGAASLVIVLRARRPWRN
jgi:hypothetical protein